MAYLCSLSTTSAVDTVLGYLLGLLYRCLFCDTASTAEYSSLSFALRSTVTGFVSRYAAVGLW